MVEAGEAAAVLRKLLSLASRGEDKALTQTASTAFLYVLRHSPAAEAHQVTHSEACHPCPSVNCLRQDQQLS